MTKLISLIWSTDSLPIVGGATGAVTGGKLLSYLPALETVISTIVLAVLGSVVGYFIKLLLDRIINKRNTGKIETR